MMDIDNRVGAMSLAGLVTVPRRLVRLQYADVAWEGNGPDGVPVHIGIERKALLDLLNSMVSGRLSGHQLIGLTNSYNYVYVLVEGMWRPRPKDGILERRSGKDWKEVAMGKRRFMYRDVANYLNTLAVRAGVTVWRTADIRESAAWLDSLYKWWNKPWDQHSSHTRFNMTGDNGAVLLRKPSLTVRMAKELAGVGWDRARAIAAHFGHSPVALVLATEEELMQVDGVGKVLAQRIRAELDVGPT